MRSFFIFLLLLVSFAFASCAFSFHNLRAATAKSVYCPPGANITIINVVRKGAITTWVAKIDNECYECQLDDNVGQTNCQRIQCFY